MELCVQLLLMSIGALLISSEEIFTNRFVFRIDADKLTNVTDLLKEKGFLYKDTFFPGVYVFQRVGEDHHEKEDLNQLQRQLGDQVKVIEQVVEFYSQTDVKTETSAVAGDETEATEPAVSNGVNIDYNTYIAMGINGAWQAGYTGRGVVVAVLDVGVNVELPDLQKNINTSLQWNYINNNSNVTPSILRSYYETEGQSDHGNRCSGLIAAVKGYGICGDGVAHGSTLVPLKIIDLIVNQIPSLIAPSDVITKGLLGSGHSVDIFSSSWSRTSAISDQTSFHMALEEGVSKGRKGKGSIYVFPAADIDDPFANDFRTITVNGVGTQGRSQSYTVLSSAVLTTSYGEGTKSQNNEMLTPSFFIPNCSEQFSGLSAATAMVAGIIALALEANTELTWRDVQHLIVESSAREGLYQHNEFTPNGAYKYYHSHLGFGLLNATRLVQLAKNWTSVPPAGHQKVDFKGTCTKSPLRPWQCIAKHVINCLADPHGICVTKLEHLRVTLNLNTVITLDNTKIVVESPNGTRSVLLDIGQMKRRSTNKLTFTTVHFWGEDLEGTWRVIIEHKTSREDEFLHYSVHFDIHGEADIVETTPSTDETVNVTIATEENTNNDKGQSSSTTIVILPIFVVLILLAVVCLIVYCRPRARPVHRARSLGTMGVENNLSVNEREVQQNLLTGSQDYVSVSTSNQQVSFQRSPCQEADQSQHLD